MKVSSLFTFFVWTCKLMCMPPKEKSNQSFSTFSNKRYSNNWDGKTIPLFQY